MSPDMLSLLDHLVSTVPATTAGHACTFGATLHRVTPILRAVPITRVFDMTPLDSIGLPVWSAVTPLALDLTVHAGKGDSAEAAMLSAIMEAIERVSAEAVQPSSVSRGTYQQLSRDTSGPEPIDPDVCDLPFDSRYSPDCPMSWIAGVDLMTRQAVLVPADVALSPATEGICCGPETNGLAAGNTYLEAIIHALYEVIERDAISCAAVSDAHGSPAPASRHPVRMIDLATVSGSSRHWIDKLHGRGIEVHVRDISHDVGVPVFHVRIVDPWFPGGAVAVSGFGASLDPNRALIRALTEAVQAHTVQLVGSRDEYESMSVRGMRPQRLARLASFYWPAERQPFQAGEWTAVCADLLTELNTLIGLLRRCGRDRCVVVDLSRGEFGIPVVRVLIPGFSHLFGLTRRRPTKRLLSLAVALTA